MTKKGRLSEWKRGTYSGATVLCQCVFEESRTFNSTKGRVTIQVWKQG